VGSTLSTRTVRYRCFSPTRPFPERWLHTSCIHTKWQHIGGKIREMGHIKLPISTKPFLQC
jgi:hypothetical protein